MDSDRWTTKDVLLWWGHVRQGEVPDEVGLRIVDRVRSGQLALVALHSAHWSVPFMEAMYSRTRDDAKRRFPHPKTKIEFVAPPGRIPPTYDSIVTPAYYAFVRRGAVVASPRGLAELCVSRGRRSRQAQQANRDDAGPPDDGGATRPIRDPGE